MVAARIKSLLRDALKTLNRIMLRRRNFILAMLTSNAVIVIFGVQPFYI